MLLLYHHPASLAPEEQARKQSKYHIGSPYSSLSLDHQLNLKHDMVDKFLCDKQSPNPAHDAENPSASIDNIACAISSRNTATTSATRREGSPRSISKAITLGLVVIGLSVAVVVGVVLGRNGTSRDDGVATQAASGGSIAQQIIVSESQEEEYSPDATGNTPMIQIAIESEPNPLKSTASEYYTSTGPLQARVKMVSPSILDGYESCSDLERDITEALKLYMDEFIMKEAVVNEIYASCDPDNDNWYSDFYGGEYYYYDHQYDDDANFTCSPANNITGCATDSDEVPWVVTWHVMDHAEGELFYNETEARVAYNGVNSSSEKRLYDPSKTTVNEDGSMAESEWCQLETWAYEAQCNGEAPTAFKKKKSTKTDTKTSARKTRSSMSHIPKSKMRSRVPGTRTSSHPEVRKSNSETYDSYEQTSQNDSANQQDKVVSDGIFIYSAYGDVLYAWDAADATRGVSITYMTEKLPENECIWNATETCTITTKPSIRALFLGDSRLTVIVSQSSQYYPIPENYTPPIITDFSTKVYVLIYDVSKVTLGFPLKEVGHKELTGDYFDGRSNGNVIFIATSSYIDTTVFTEDLSRYQSQYCGLDSAGYKELAAEKATKQVESFAKQVFVELEVANDCSRIVQISMMRSSIDESGLTRTDILGRFIQVSIFDSSTDFGADDIPLTVVGAFTGYGYSIYLADDFLAIPSNVFEFNYSYDVLSSETFILGFDLSTKDHVTPYCYGHVPGALENNYYMDKLGGYLRIVVSEQSVVAYTHKLYVLGLPSVQEGPGKMLLVGEIENLTDGNEVIPGVRFVEDKAYISAKALLPERINQFYVVDLSDPKNPSVVGHLNTSSYFWYLEQIDIKNVPYVLGVGDESEEMAGSWQLFVRLSLIDVSTPSSPKIAASYREAGSSLDQDYDFLTVRYLSDLQKLILPVSRTDHNSSGINSYTEGFVLYDISDYSIIRAFNVTQSTSETYCWYDARIPARSFVIRSELITIKGHTAVSTEMKNGTIISKLDLDVNFNYSVCDAWWSIEYNNYFENLGDVYRDAIDGASINSTVL